MRKPSAVLAFQVNDGRTRPEILAEFAELIRSGAHHRVTGFYRRAACDLIDRGIIHDDGTIVTHPAFPSTMVAA